MQKDRGLRFLSTDRANEVNKSFIIWHFPSIYKTKIEERKLKKSRGLACGVFSRQNQNARRCVKEPQDFSESDSNLSEEIFSSKFSSVCLHCFCFFLICGWIKNSVFWSLRWNLQKTKRKTCLCWKIFRWLCCFELIATQNIKSCRVARNNNTRIRSYTSLALVIKDLLERKERKNRYGYILFASGNILRLADTNNKNKQNEAERDHKSKEKLQPYKDTVRTKYILLIRS